MSSLISSANKIQPHNGRQIVWQSNCKAPEITSQSQACYASSLGFTSQSCTRSSLPGASKGDFSRGWSASQVAKKTCPAHPRETVISMLHQLWSLTDILRLTANPDIISQQIIVRGLSIAIWAELTGIQQVFDVRELEDLQKKIMEMRIPFPRQTKTIAHMLYNRKLFRYCPSLYARCTERCSRLHDVDPVEARGLVRASRSRRWWTRDLHEMPGQTWRSLHLRQVQAHVLWVLPRWRRRARHCRRERERHRSKSFGDMHEFPFYICRFHCVRHQAARCPSRIRTKHFTSRLELQQR